MSVAPVPDLNGLRYLLGEARAADFLASVWQQTSLHVVRDAAAYFASLFSIEDVDAVITTTSPNADTASLRLVRSTDTDFVGEVVPKSSDGALDIPALYQRYAEGYTIAVHRLEQRWIPIMRLARGLTRDLGARTTVGLYLTPSGTKGLAPHFDACDVFVLQLYGQKTWTLYPIVEDVGGGPQLDPALSPTTTCVVRPGDVLYVPRFMGHEAQCEPGSPSLHLTVAVHVTTVLDLIHRALTRAARHSAALRTAVPLDADEQLAVPLVYTAMAELLPTLDAYSALQALRTEHLSHLSPMPDGHFRSLDRVAALTERSVLRRRPGPLEVEDAGGGIFNARFAGGVVPVHGACRPALEFIASTPAFRVDEIPGRITTGAKLVLVRRLVQGGLLSIVET